MGVFQLTHQPGVTPEEAYDTDFAANYAARMLRPIGTFWPGGSRTSRRPS
jgi:hypothetical protein